MSQAIKTGFQYALDNGYDNVVTIDGDGGSMTLLRLLYYCSGWEYCVV